ncbi:hypothetical protein KKA69_05620 [Patescibacteria group bacterium]|nr:hypothetical protein [Patescibacteria group bacterium]
MTVRSITLESANFMYLAHWEAPEDHVDALCAAVDTFMDEQRDVTVSSVHITRMRRLLDSVEFTLVPTDNIAWDRLEALSERFADLVDKHVGGAACDS